MVVYVYVVVYLGPFHCFSHIYTDMQVDKISNRGAFFLLYPDK
jgi:hypothetical protein